MNTNNMESCIAYIEHLRRLGHTPKEVRDLLASSDYSSLTAYHAIRAAKKMVMWTVFPTYLNKEPVKQRMM